MTYRIFFLSTEYGFVSAVMFCRRFVNQQGLLRALALGCVFQLGAALGALEVLGIMAPRIRLRVPPTSSRALQQ